MWTALLVGVAWACVGSVGGFSEEPKQYHIQTDDGPERYFRYQTFSGQYRKEKRLDDGSVVGTYGWVDATGLLRLYDYIADHKGYRIVRTKTIRVPDSLRNPEGTNNPASNAVNTGTGSFGHRNNQGSAGSGNGITPSSGVSRNPVSSSHSPSRNTPSRNTPSRNTPSNQAKTSSTISSAAGDTPQPVKLRPLTVRPQSTQRPRRRGSVQWSRQPIQPSNHLPTQPSNHLHTETSNHLSTQQSNHLPSQPSNHPTTQPSTHLSSQPSNHLSPQPLSQPSNQLVLRPLTRPPIQPSSQPVLRPLNQQVDEWDFGAKVATQHSNTEHTDTSHEKQVTHAPATARSGQPTSRTKADIHPLTLSGEPTSGATTGTHPLTHTGEQTTQLLKRTGQEAMTSRGPSVRTRGRTRFRVTEKSLTSAPRTLNGRVRGRPVASARETNQARTNNPRENNNPGEAKPRENNQGEANPGAGSLGSDGLPVEGEYTINYDLGSQFHVEKVMADGTKVGKHGYVDPLGILRVSHYTTGPAGHNQTQESRWVGTRDPGSWDPVKT